MGNRARDEIALLQKHRVLITESLDEFKALLKAAEQDIGPRGIIERIFVHDICLISWEMRRLHRCKTSIVTIGLRAALEDVLIRVLKTPEKLDSSVRDEAEALALGWFTDPEIKKQISGLLARFHLEEFDIEAESTRRSSSDLALLDRMLTSLETRRNKAIRSICDYRDSLGQQLRETSDRLIEGDDALRVTRASGQKPAAA
jgi:hypothetical protein